MALLDECDDDVAVSSGGLLSDQHHVTVVDAFLDHGVPAHAKCEGGSIPLKRLASKWTTDSWCSSARMGARRNVSNERDLDEVVARMHRARLRGVQPSRLTRSAFSFLRYPFLMSAFTWSDTPFVDAMPSASPISR